MSSTSTNNILKKIMFVNNCLTDFILFLTEKEQFNLMEKLDLNIKKTLFNKLIFNNRYQYFNLKNNLKLYSYKIFNINSLFQDNLSHITRIYDIILNTTKINYVEEYIQLFNFLKKKTHKSSKKLEIKNVNFFLYLQAKIYIIVSELYKNPKLNIMVRTFRIHYNRVPKLKTIYKLLSDYPSLVYCNKLFLDEEDLKLLNIICTINEDINQIYNKPIKIQINNLPITLDI